MASACVNNISMSPATYRWLSPRISFSRELPDDGSSGGGSTKPQTPTQKLPEPSTGDFEFRLEDPVTMLPADELFSDGKLVPLHLSSLKPSPGACASRAFESPEKYRRRDVVDPYLFSPKAPRCSSRWRELLGLKKVYQNSSGGSNLKTGESPKTTSSPASSSSNLNSKTLKNFLHRSSKSSSSSSDGTLSLPLLRDSDSESVSISSSRLSLSSSSSGHDHDDLPRLSLDSDKPAPNPFRSPNPNPPRTRLVPTNSTRPGRSPMRRAVAEPNSAASRGASVDSPRMNSSGKIVFQSLERSSSSPSSFNGGPRFKPRGMERSYSGNVRVAPVLNVRVPGSVFGFGQLFSSPQKRDSNGGATTTTRPHHHRSNRTDRT